MAETYHIDSKTVHIGVTCITNWKRHIRVNKPKSNKTPSFILRWRTLRYRAANKRIPFDLLIFDVEDVLNSPCEYCGSTKRIEVDRKDSSLGYTKDNIAPACHRCNTIKNNVVTYDEMMKIVDILGWRV